MPKRECLDCRALFEVERGQSRCGVCRTVVRQRRDSGRRSPAYRALSLAIKNNVIICAVDECEARATQVDHIILFAHGGTEAMSNLRPVCAYHNASKNH